MNSILRIVDTRPPSFLMIFRMASSIFSWDNRKGWKPDTFWLFFDYFFFENHQKGYLFFKKRSEKASCINLEHILSSHAKFHWNPSTRKKVMPVRKMSHFFKPKIFGNEGRQVRWLGHQSLDMQMIYYSSKWCEALSFRIFWGPLMPNGGVLHSLVFFL